MNLSTKHRASLWLCALIAFSGAWTSVQADPGSVMTIAEARTLPFGTRVTVAGRVTVGNEFGGPSVFQDATAGLSAYHIPLHAAVAIGDSLVITGPLTEFNPNNGPIGTYLVQIAARGGDSDIQFTVFKDNPKPVAAKTITIQQMNAGGYESQLVTLRNVTIVQTGSFRGNTNYTIQRDGASAVLRIATNTNTVGETIPTGPVDITGVIDRFSGVYQLKPRFSTDLGIEPFVDPGNDIPMSHTFDVVTWNIEWFGHSQNGPTNKELQFQNVKSVITTLDADIYALQEIANPQQFNRLVQELTDYGGFQASFSQDQKTAYLFKRSTIDSLNSGMITTGLISYDFGSGRFPLMFHFNATIQGQSREIYAFNIHAKAFSDQESYNRRVRASAQMKQYLDERHVQQPLIFLGDFNDNVTVSTYAGQVSPYQNFVDDTNYLIPTKRLSERGATSYRTSSMIDHIVIGRALFSEIVEGAEKVATPTHISSYFTTTSDHSPVMVRFVFDETVSIDKPTEPERALGIELEQNVPNPFNPSTVIGFRVETQDLASPHVTLSVYDMLGREVAVLVDGAMSAGYHQATFNASNLSSGMYIYRLETAQGAVSRRMLLLK
jgi:endonuclease/exonuclease/phosphatase family metal-dependent hydrolase